MYLISTSLYPGNKAKEVAERYLKAMAKYPDDKSIATAVVPGAVRSTVGGIKVMIIYDVKKGKFEEAHLAAVNRHVMLHDIPGYQYNLKTFLNLEEAMKAIGM